MIEADFKSSFIIAYSTLILNTRHNEKQSKMLTSLHIICLFPLTH